MSSTKITLQYICSSGNTLRVTTFGGISGAESTIKSFEEFEVNRNYLDSKTDEIMGCLRKAVSKPAPAQPRPAASLPGNNGLNRICEMGQDLYKELVPSTLRIKLSENAGKNLLLAIDSSLAWIPWELLHNGDDFFCRFFNMGRIVSVRAPGGVVEKRTLRLPARHLIIADPEGNLPGAAAEGRRTRRMLLEHGENVRPVFLSGRVSESGLIDGLKKADVFHFAGHLSSGDFERSSGDFERSSGDFERSSGDFERSSGDFERSSGDFERSSGDFERSSGDFERSSGDFERSGQSARIRLKNGMCSARQIEKFRGRFPFPALVFLNGCCSSAFEGPLLIETAQERTFGMASSFLICGVRHFIGTLWDVPDSAASAAGVGFFEAFYSGSSVGEALREARSALAEERGEHSMDWAGYVLYGDPSFTPS